MVFVKCQLQIFKISNWHASTQYVWCQIGATNDDYATVSYVVECETQERPLFSS